MEEWEEKNILILPCHPIGSFGNPGITDEMVKDAQPCTSIGVKVWFSGSDIAGFNFEL
jgi:hypothetical protein